MLNIHVAVSSTDKVIKSMSEELHVVNKCWGSDSIGYQRSILVLMLK